MDAMNTIFKIRMAPKQSESNHTNSLSSKIFQVTRFLCPFQRLVGQVNRPDSERRGDGSDVFNRSGPFQCHLDQTRCGPLLGP